MSKEVTYEPNDPLATEIARRYIAKDSDLSHITLGEVRFVRVIGKSPKDKIVDVKGIKEPINLFTDFKYVVVIYADAFDSLSEIKQNLFILWALTNIGEEFDGDKRKEEIKEYAKFVSTFGAYWYMEDDEFLAKRSGVKIKKTTSNVSKEQEELNGFLATQ